VPRLLTEEQKEQRVAISQELLDQANDVETKAQFSQLVSKAYPRPKKACQVRSHVKVMLIAFFPIMRELSVIHLYLVDRQ
jgi:hypothetical protein